MRRSTVRWGFGIAVVVSVSGCASLLGDFTTSNESGGDDGGANGDGSPNNTIEGSSGDDGSLGSPDGSGDDGSSTQDAPAGDANEAGSIVPLTCVEQAGSGRIKLGTISKGGGGGDGNKVQLFNTSVPNGQSRYRAFVPEQGSGGPSINHVFSLGYGNGSNNVSDVPIPSNNGQVFTLVRYPGGLAALVSTTLNDAGLQIPALAVVKLDDSAASWSAPVIIATSPNVPTCAGNNTRQSGALLVRDAAQDDYFYELVDQGCSGSPGQFHVTGHSVNGVTAQVNWPQPPEKIEVPDGGDAGTADAGTPQFDPAGLVVSGTNLYAMTNPQGNGGPDPGIGAAVFTATLPLTNAGVSARELPLVNDSDLMQGLSIGGLSSGIGFAFLEANLSSQTVTPMIYTGIVPSAQMATFTPAANLRATTLPSISDLPINSASYHWESFGAPFASDNLLAMGAIFPNSNGLNFIWWDGAGNVRAQKTNGNAFFYYDAVDAGTSGLTLTGGDITFNSAPFGAIAGFEMVFVKTDSEASTVSDVWATQVNCSP